MKKIMEIITGIFSFLIFYIGGFCVHIFTCFVVSESYGSFLGIIAFFCPVISTIIMFLLYLIFYGLFNDFCIAILVYIGLVAFTFLLASITEFFDKKEQEKYSNINNYNNFEPSAKQIRDNIIHKFMNDSGLSEKVCLILYDILTVATRESREMAMTMIYNILIPQLKNEQILSNVGIAMEALISDVLLTRDEANQLAYNVMMDMTENNYDINI